MSAITKKHQRPTTDRRKITARDRVSFCDEVERELVKIGFTPANRSKWEADSKKDPSIRKSLPRFKLTLGKWHCLTPNDECPCWTLQEWTAGQCEYIDFPISVDARRLVAFILA